jgi:hypothetical protein
VRVDLPVIDQGDAPLCPAAVVVTMASYLAAWDRFELVPEELWPFEPARIDEAPPEECYRAALRSSILPRRLDAVSGSRADLVGAMRRHLAAGLPLCAGYPAHPGQFTALSTGVLPLLEPGTPTFGTHVVTALGYSDDLRPQTSEPGNRGAFRVRNSWGEQRGRSGYGWRPDDFVAANLVSSVWAVCRPEWVVRADDRS